MAEFGLTPVYGGAGIGSSATWTNEAQIEEVYKTLEQNGCKTIDTARLYGDSETWLGKTKAGERFVIDSKTPGGFIAGGSTAEGILQHAKDAVARIGVKQLDIYYIHAPDAGIPLEDMLKGITDAHQQGLFRRFGLSNYTAADVQQVYDVCKAKGYVLPTVYQGNYSAVARRQETELFPALRKLGISFYAYSPMAGGFLAKTPEQLRGSDQDAGRFAEGHPISAMYNSLYASKDSYIRALEMWAKAAKAAGCGKAELAYRWIAFDSPLDRKHGDAIIFGASKLHQISETLGWLRKGSVGPEACTTIDEIWKVIEHEAPLDNYNSFQKDKS